jgi:hypothetical protein
VEDFIFCEGAAPAGFKFDYETTLFNLSEHRQIQSPDHWISYYVLGQKEKKIYGEIHFHVTDRIASSPCRSPFGSVDASVNIEPATLFKFLEYVDASLGIKGIRKVIIKGPPTIYQNKIQVLVQTFLLNLKYQISNGEISAVLVADKPFDELSHQWEKRKVRHTKTTDLRLKHHPAEDLEILYNLIFECRQKKGYSSSMTFEDLQRIVNTFPDRFVLTSIHKNEEMVAASVSIQLNRRVLYHFYSDHIRPISELNPTIFLIKGLYEYALKNNIEIVDLGTSSLDGYPNFGLLDFKIGLGTTLTSKFTFEKILT